MKYGWTSPSRMEPGQNDRVVFVVILRVLDAEVHCRLSPWGTGVGVIQGRPLVPWLSSIGAASSRAWAHGAKPGVGEPARMSAFWRGRSEGVGTTSSCSKVRSVSSAAWKMYPGGAGMD